MNKIAPYAGWLAIFLAIITLFVYVVAPAETTMALSILGLSLLNAIFFLAVEREKVRLFFSGRAAIYGANTLALTLAFTGILIFANLLSYRHKFRFDMTENKIYTLSAQTKKVVANLGVPIKITAFFQTESPAKLDFKNLADGYLALTNKITLEFVDPDKNPAIAKQYGIKTYGAIAIEHGKNETNITNATEETLTNGIIKVIQTKVKTIYFLEGHGEKGLAASDNSGYSTLKGALEKYGYKVEKLLLLQSGEIPANADLLVAGGPEKPLAPQETGILNSYLERGGALFLLIDPQTEAGLGPVTEKWGIEIHDDLIIDPLSKLFGGDFAAPVISEFGAHDITKNFALTAIFPMLRSVSFKPAEGVSAAELFKTGPNSWAETEYRTPKVKFDAGADRQGPVPGGVVATRAIKGKDAAPKDGQETPADPAAEGEEKKEAFAKARLVVLGDSDFASNAYFNFSGNGDLFLNIVSWMLQEENLISIRPKERKNTPVHLTRSQGSLIFLTSVIVIPALTLGIGARIWWKRRAL